MTQHDTLNHEQDNPDDYDFADKLFGDIGADEADDSYAGVINRLTMFGLVYGVDVLACVIRRVRVELKKCKVKKGCGK